MRRVDLLRQLEISQRDLVDAEQQIEKWRATRQLHFNEIKNLKKDISALDTEDQRQVEPVSDTQDSINYMEREFQWSKQLKSKLKKIFGIDDFRLCQKGCVVTSDSTPVRRFTPLLAVFVMRTYTKGI